MLRKMMFCVGLLIGFFGGWTACVKYHKDQNDSVENDNA